MNHDATAQEGNCMTNLDTNGARRTLERQIVRDAEGNFEGIVARVGCAEAVLATPGKAPNQLLMPRRALVHARLAELDGPFGGLLKMGYDQTERDLIDGGISIAFVTAPDFMRCTERSKPNSPICRTPECPWSVEGEEYAPGECPMDHWKSFQP